jgi:hypothetical protein
MLSLKHIMTINTCEGGASVFSVSAQYTTRHFLVWLPNDLVPSRKGRSLRQGVRISPLLHDKPSVHVYRLHKEPVCVSPHTNFLFTHIF